MCDIEAMIALDALHVVAERIVLAWERSGRATHDMLEDGDADRGKRLGKMSPSIYRAKT